VGHKGCKNKTSSHPLKISFTNRYIAAKIHFMKKKTGFDFTMVGLWSSV
jgi:hypothetical protein